jgi:predicted solute-binding protein
VSDPGTLTLGYAPDPDDAFRFYPHVLLNAGRLGVAASASEWTNHHSLALAATRQINV